MKCPFSIKSLPDPNAPTFASVLTYQDCLKEECSLWVALTSNQEEHGKCALAWIPTLLIELRVAVEKLSGNPEKMNKNA